MIIDGGRIGDRQLLDPQWLAEATSYQTDNSSQENPDWSQGYGYQFWMARHGFRGDGAYGQFCVVLPEQDAVVAITSASSDMQGILDRIWEHLLPAFGDQPQPADDNADAALAERLAGLTLTPVGAEDWQPQPIPEPVNNPATNRDPVRVIKVDQDGDVITLTLDHDQQAVGAPLRPSTDDVVQLEINCGVGHWVANTIAIGDHTLACSGSAVAGSDGTIDAELSFINTPHRLRLRHTADGTRSGWITEPLGEPYPENLAIKLVDLS
ncbi:hypothetical protein GCM10027613_39780 [Microlunatus endophyticus]